MIDVGLLVLELYPAVVVAYLVDCLVRLRPAALLLVRRFGRSAVERGPRFVFAGLLASDRAYAVAPATLAPTTRGIFVQRYDGTPVARYRRESYEFVAYEETAWTLDGASLRDGGAILATFASAERAAAFAAFKRALTGAAAAERRRLLAEPGAEFRRLAAAVSALRPLLRLVQYGSFAFFAAVFAVLPGLALGGADAESWVRAAALATVALYAAVALLTAAAAWSMRRAAVELPHAFLLASLLFPLAAAHASYQLTRKMAAGADLLSAAAVLLPERDFVALARTEAYGLEVAAQSSDDAPWRELVELRRAMLVELLQWRGIDPSSVRRPPAASDAAARLWCPFCSAEYVAGGGACAQCEVPLVELAADAQSAV